VAIRVDASDADGDPLTYAFEVTSKVVGAEFEAVSDGDVLLLTAKTAGGYAIKVTVSDGLATTAATTAVYVEEAPCP
jgi:hypothetical protein